MNVEYEEGDLFDFDALGAWAHGVNCCGVMGAGIAKTFKQRFPEMYKQYKLRCSLDLLQLGDVMPWTADGNGCREPFIFNIASQYLPGPHASLAALELGLMQSMVWTQKLGQNSLGVPRIGAGIGGLQWDDVKEVYESTAKHVPDVQLVVITPPQPKE